MIRKVNKIISVDNSDTLTNVEYIQYSDLRISTETLEITPFLQSEAVSVVEGDSGTTLAQFTFELSTTAPVNVQFDYTTVDGEAIAGEDYLATSGQITITPEQTTATVEVEIIGDTLQEPNESFALNLSGLSGASFDNLESEYAVIANIENDDQPIILYGDAGNDTLIGEEQNDLLYGGAGNDSLVGNDGEDYLDGGTNNDTLRGGNDDDFLDGGNDNDALYGDNGNDIVNGGAGNDSVRGNAGDDTLIGGEGNDTMFAHEGDDVLIGVNPDSENPGENEIDLIKGDADSNIFVLGDEFLAYYQNNSPADYVQINGFQIGLDTIELHGSIGDYQLQTVGTQTHILYGDNHELIGRVHNVTGLTLASSEFEFLNDKPQMYGTEDDDTIIGGDSNQDLRGFEGNDLIYGGAGNDSVRGFEGNDTLIGGEGNDTMFAHGGDDVLIGVNPDSNNPGENEIDLIKGDADSNTYVLGNEFLAYYQNNSAADYAQINGFQIGLDTIELHGSIGDYQLQTVGTQTHILYSDNNELIGKVHNVTGLDLASSEFTYV